MEPYLSSQKEKHDHNSQLGFSSHLYMHFSAGEVQTPQSFKWFPFKGIKKRKGNKYWAITKKFSASACLLSLLYSIQHIQRHLIKLSQIKRTKLSSICAVQINNFVGDFYHLLGSVLETWGVSNRLCVHCQIQSCSEYAEVLCLDNWREKRLFLITTWHTLQLFIDTQAYLLLHKYFQWNYWNVAQE